MKIIYSFEEFEILIENENTEHEEVTFWIGDVSVAFTKENIDGIVKALNLLEK